MSRILDPVIQADDTSISTTKINDSCPRVHASRSGLSMATNTTCSYEAYQAYFDRLVSAVTPVIADLARQAFAKNLITLQHLRESENLMLSADRRSSSLLQHILVRIEQNPNHFN